MTAREHILLRLQAAVLNLDQLARLHQGSELGAGFLADAYEVSNVIDRIHSGQVR